MNADTENSNTNQLTTVKTIYARAVVLLLALNFCLTGYVMYNMNSTMQEQIDAAYRVGHSVPITAIPLSKKDN